MRTKKELTKKDVELLVFMAKHRMIYTGDCKYIYNANWYYIKRINDLLERGYIKRYKHYYLKLGIKGINLIKELNYEYENKCRNSEFIDRLKNICRIATISINSEIEFIPSWRLKEKGQYTRAGCKIIGEIVFDYKRRAAYHINKVKESVYIRQVMNDINKLVELEDIMIFTDRLDIICEKYKYFRLNRDSILIIHNTRRNIEILMNYHNIDYYDIMSQIYETCNIQGSDYFRADYMISKNHYAVYMPFLDVEKLFKIKDYKKGIKLDILTLEENSEIVYEILGDDTNLIYLDKYIGGRKFEKNIGRQKG